MIKKPRASVSKGFLNKTRRRAFSWAREPRKKMPIDRYGQPPENGGGVFSGTKKKRNNISQIFEAAPLGSPVSVGIPENPVVKTKTRRENPVRACFLIEEGGGSPELCPES